MEYQSRILLIKPSFVDDTIMVVTKSGTNEPSMVFVNQQKLPDLGYQSYLDRLSTLPPDNHAIKLEPKSEIAYSEREEETATFEPSLEKRKSGDIHPPNE